MADGDTLNDAPAAPPLGVGKGYLYDLWYFAALGSELKPGAHSRHVILGEPVLLGREATVTFLPRAFRALAPRPPAGEDSQPAARLEQPFSAEPIQAPSALGEATVTSCNA